MHKLIQKTLFKFGKQPFFIKPSSHKGYKIKDRGKNMDTILTPNESTTARVSLGLSQASVARDTGINRVYISQFEGEKRILDDSELHSLRDHYIANGWEPSDELEPSTEENINQLETSEPPVRIWDGFLVPNLMPVDEVENLLDEYHNTKARISELEKEGVSRGIFGGLYEQETFNKSVKVMLHYVLLHRIVLQLQGRTDEISDTLSRTELYLNREGARVECSGDYIQYLLNALENNRNLN